MRRHRALPFGEGLRLWEPERKNLLPLSGPLFSPCPLLEGACFQGPLADAVGEGRRILQGTGVAQRPGAHTFKSRLCFCVSSSALLGKLEIENPDGPSQWPLPHRTSTHVCTWASGPEQGFRSLGEGGKGELRLRPPQVRLLLILPWEARQWPRCPEAGMPTEEGAMRVLKCSCRGKGPTVEINRWALAWRPWMV